nr:MAG TPA: hypothetical protein [Caudoviricetes sp.]
MKAPQRNFLRLILSFQCSNVSLYYKLSLLVDTKACLCYACCGDFGGTLRVPFCLSKNYRKSPDSSYFLKWFSSISQIVKLKLHLCFSALLRSLFLKSEDILTVKCSVFVIVRFL